MNKDEKLDIFREAVKLADSGKYKGWKKVQSQLVKSGHKRVPEFLDGNKIRMILDAHCKLASSRG